MDECFLERGIGPMPPPATYRNEYIDGKRDVVCFQPEYILDSMAVRLNPNISLKIQNIAIDCEKSPNELYTRTQVEGLVEQFSSLRELSIVFGKSRYNFPKLADYQYASVLIKVDCNFISILCYNSDCRDPKHPAGFRSNVQIPENEESARLYATVLSDMTNSVGANISTNCYMLGEPVHVQVEDIEKIFQSTPVLKY